MILKVNLCGIAVAYHEKVSRKTQLKIDLPSRPQGSRYNSQKIQLANAIEWMRLYGDNKPLVFVLTSPRTTSLANEPRFLNRFLTYLRKDYGMIHYAWCREMTKKGYPHFHFVADVPSKEFMQDITNLSLVWSSYFDVDAKNSIRVGVYKNNKRVGLYIRNAKMAFYMSKYFGKEFGAIDHTMKLKTRKRKQFSISQKLRGLSEPLLYEDFITEKKNEYGGIVGVDRQFVCVSDHTNEEGTIITNKDLVRSYTWKQCGLHPVYKGHPKAWK